MSGAKLVIWLTGDPGENTEYATLHAIGDFAKSHFEGKVEFAVEEDAPVFAATERVYLTAEAAAAAAAAAPIENPSWNPNIALVRRVENTETFTVVGLIEDDSGELLVSGVVKGEIPMADSGDTYGFTRWAQSYQATDAADAEAQAKADNPT